MRRVVVPWLVTHDAGRVYGGGLHFIAGAESSSATIPLPRVTGPGHVSSFEGVGALTRGGMLPHWS